MRLTRDGRAALGVGDGQVSVAASLQAGLAPAFEVAATVLGAGGGTCWLTDDRVLYQRRNSTGSNYHLESCLTDGSLVEFVAGTGANELRAGHGAWAAWNSTGLFCSSGFARAEAGLLDVSSDGVLAYCPDRSTGLGAILRDLTDDSDVRAVPECRASGVRLVGSMLVWTQAGAVRADHDGDPAPPVVVEGVVPYAPVPVLARGWRRTTWWLVAQHVWIDAGVEHRRLVLHPWDSTTGYVVHEGGAYYSPDAVCLTEDVVRVAWCATPGEGPTSLRVRDLTLTAPRVRLDRVSTPEPPTMPEQPNHLDLVRQARAEHDTLPPGDERGWRITNRTVYLCNQRETALGLPANFGLLAKTSGTNYTGYSLDCVMRRTGETWDVLGDAEGAAKAQWTRTTPTGMTDPAKWRAYVPVALPHPPTEPPTEPPQPPATDLDARVAALEAWARSFR